MPKLTAGPVLLLFAAAAFGLAGCSSSEAGNPVPSAGVPSSGSDSSPAPSTSSTGSSAVDTASIQPCSLLAVSDLAEYGTFTGPTAKELGGARVCSFLRQLASASDKGLTVSIGVRDSQGISTVNDLGGGKRSGTINGRETITASGSAQSGCLVALAVGDKARVDVSVTSSDGASTACTAADKIAAVVEPKLPKG